MPVRIVRRPATKARRKRGSGVTASPTRQFRVLLDHAGNDPVLDRFVSAHPVSRAPYPDARAVISVSRPVFRSVLTADKAPRYLRNAHQNYWFEHVPELGAIYLQYNRAQQMSTNPVSEFTETVSRAIDEHPVKALVVDVRFNTGGDAGVGSPLVEKLAAKLRGVTGRATFSAGMTHAAQWKQLARATVIGER